MPTEKGRWLNNEQGIFPVPQPVREQDEEDSVCVRQTLPLDRSVEDQELSTEQGVFNDKLWLASGHVKDAPDSKEVLGGLVQDRSWC
jgi:hypothetical protein